MKRFRFSLEAVATIRHHEEEQARQKFAQASRAHRQALEKLHQTEQELSSTMAERRSTGFRTASDHCQLQEWQTTLQQRVEMQTEVVNRAAHARSEANQELTLARQSRDIVEKLRCQRMSRHEQAGIKAEQKAIDEMASRGTLARGLLNDSGV